MSNSKSIMPLKGAFKLCSGPCRTVLPINSFKISSKKSHHEIKCLECRGTSLHVHGLTTIVCTTCEIEKNYEEFEPRHDSCYANDFSIDGRRSQCKLCHENQRKLSENYELRRQNALKISGQWFMNNPEYSSQYHITYSESEYGCTIIKLGAAKTQDYVHNKKNLTCVPLDYNLTLEYIEQLKKNQNGKCIITGIQMVFQRGAGAIQGSFDRIDNSKGHVIGNIRLTLTCVNYLHNSLNESDFNTILDEICYENQFTKISQNIAELDNVQKIKDIYSGQIRTMKNMGMKIGYTSYELVHYIDNHKYCELTGIPVNWEKDSLNMGSIDRIVPELGYVKGNIRVVIFQINLMKNIFNDEVIKYVLKQLITYRTSVLKHDLPLRQIKNIVDYKWPFELNRTHQTCFGGCSPDPIPIANFGISKKSELPIYICNNCVTISLTSKQLTQCRRNFLID